jgi:hypothetical protein
MTLEVADAVVSTTASPRDVEQAVDAAAPSGEWYLNLTDGGDDFMECRTDGSRFILECRDDGSMSRSVDSVDAATAKVVLVAYLTRDSQWRTRVTWGPLADAPGIGGTLPRARVVLPLVGAAAVLVAGLLWLSHQPTVLAALPEPLNEPGFWPVGLIWLAIPGIILFVVFKKAIDVKRAASWTPVLARVTKSGMRIAHVGGTGATAQVRNLPAIEYEFASADGHHVVGTRISLGEDAAVNAAETLSKYPVGTQVTAYYNPRKPAECVIEREPPARMALIVLVVVLAVVGVPVAGFVGLRAIYHALEAGLPNGQPVFVMFFAAAALIVLLAGIASMLLARRATTWPLAPGLVRTSGVGSYQSSLNGRQATFFKPEIVYAYTVNGREFSSGRIDFGAAVGTGKALALSKAAEFPVGLQVQVHYDPANPSEAVLRTSAGSPLLAFGLVAVFLGLAYFFSGLRRPW